MLTFAQIGAIISLLLAFGVGQPTVNTVQDILNTSVSTTTSIVASPIPQTVVIASSTQPVPLVIPVTTPLFGATIQPQVTKPAMPTPSDIVITHTTPIAGKTTLIITFNPILSDGTTDENAHLTVTSTAPWWFPHGATVCKEGCNLKINTPFDVFPGWGSPSDPGTYSMTATWEGTNVSKTIDITVLPNPEQ